MTSRRPVVDTQGGQGDQSSRSARAVLPRPVNPCLACTVGKWWLRDGQRSNSICHLRRLVLSLVQTMCANGPAASPAPRPSARPVDQSVVEVLAARIVTRPTPYSSSASRSGLSTTRPSARVRRRQPRHPTLRSEACGSPSRCRAASRSGSRTRQAWASGRCSAGRHRG